VGSPNEGPALDAVEGPAELPPVSRESQVLSAAGALGNSTGTSAVGGSEGPGAGGLLDSSDDPVSRDNQLLSFEIEAVTGSCEGIEPAVSFFNQEVSSAISNLA